MKFCNEPAAKFLSFFFSCDFREIGFNHFLQYAIDRVRERKPPCDSRSEALKIILERKKC